MKLVNIHRRVVLLLMFLTGFQLAGQAQVWTLDQCLETARANNKNLQISRNNILIGEQKQEEVKANLMPKVNFSADYKYFIDLPYQLLPAAVFGGPEGQFKEAQFGVPHNINASLQLSMPLYSPQLRGAKEMTQIAGKVNQLQYQKTEEQLFFDISNLYYNAQILASQAAFLDSNLINATRLLNTMQLLHEQLMVKGTDVDKVQLQVTQLSTQQALVASKYEQLMNALKFAMGVAITEKIEVNSDIEYQDEMTYNPLSTLNFRLAKTRNQLLTSELNTLKKTLRPSVALFASYGYTGFGYDQQPNAFLDFYPVSLVGVKLNYPLFDKTVGRKINQKQFELTNNQLQMNLIADQNVMQVENTQLQRFTTQNYVEATLAQIELAQSIYDQTVLQQKQGVATLTDVLLADNSLREAQQTYISAVVDYLKADLELKKLTGNILK